MIDIHKNELILPPNLIVPVGKVMIELHNVVTGERSISFDNNMVVTAGKNAIAAGLLDTTKGNITYCAVGTGITAPALADTTLQTELGRKQISVRSVAANVATFQTFFTTSEIVGTLKEAGLFGDLASATANSGTLFCRVAINRIKSANDTLTLSWAVTIG